MTKAAKAKPEPKKATGPAKVTRYQKFKPAQIHRRQIKNAEYNPRHIDPYAKKKLQRVLQKHGLVSSITWNKRTGNIVGGHQRLEALDALEGHDNYLLDVDQVDVDDLEEKQLNIVLNNPGIQGQYVPDLLGALLAEISEADEKFDLTDTLGFEPLEIEATLAGTEYESLFSDATDEIAEEALVQTEEMHGDAKATEEAQRDPKTGLTPQETAKRNRATMNSLHKTDDDAETYVVVTCTSREECMAVARALGAPSLNDKFIDVRRVAHKLGFELPKTERV